MTRKPNIDELAFDSSVLPEKPKSEKENQEANVRSLLEGWRARFPEELHDKVTLYRNGVAVGITPEEGITLLGKGRVEIIGVSPILILKEVQPMAEKKKDTTKKATPPKATPPKPKTTPNTKPVKKAPAKVAPKPKTPFQKAKDAPTTRKKKLDDAWKKMKGIK